MASGQWMVSQEGTEWFFEAGALSLDWAYTGDFELGQPKWERLHGPDDVTRWMTEHLMVSTGTASEDDLARALQLRAAVSRAARALVQRSTVSGADAAALDHAAAQPDVPPQLQPGDERPSATLQQALSTIARDLITHVASRPERLRLCAADDCGLIFLDTSRPGTRRWCSMQRCGNRAKVRNHRQHTDT